MEAVMATMQEFPYRGEEIQLVEEYFNHPDPAVRGDRLRAALDRLVADEDLELGFIDAGEDLTELEARLAEGASVDHFKRHWLGHGEDSAFWPGLDGADVAATVRRGFADAMQEALDLDLPLTVIQV